MTRRTDKFEARKVEKYYFAGLFCMQKKGRFKKYKVLICENRIGKELTDS